MEGVMDMPWGTNIYFFYSTDVFIWCVFIFGVCSYLVSVHIWCVFISGVCSYLVCVHIWCAFLCSS